MGYNKVTLIGNLGKDPEIRTFDNGNRVANFAIATSEKYKDKKGEIVETTDWHNVAIFGKVVDVVEKYVKKGSKILVEGKLKTRNYQKDGNKVYVTEVVLSGFDSKMVLLDSKPTSDNLKQDNINARITDEIDDLPF